MFSVIKSHPTHVLHRSWTSHVNEIVNFLFVLLHKTYWPIYVRKVNLPAFLKGRHRPWNSKRLWLLFVSMKPRYTERVSRAFLALSKECSHEIHLDYYESYILRKSYSLSTKNEGSSRKCGSERSHMHGNDTSEHTQPNRQNRVEKQNISDIFHKKCNLSVWNSSLRIRTIHFCCLIE